jgi:hypothetical protein
MQANQVSRRDVVTFKIAGLPVPTGGRILLTTQPGYVSVSDIDHEIIAIANAGATLVLSIMDDETEAEAIGAAVRRNGLEWHTLSSASVNAQDEHLDNAMSRVHSILEDGGLVAIHGDGSNHAVDHAVDLAGALLHEHGMDKMFVISIVRLGGYKANWETVKSIVATRATAKPTYALAM